MPESTTMQKSGLSQLLDDWDANDSSPLSVGSVADERERLEEADEDDPYCTVPLQCRKCRDDALRSCPHYSVEMEPPDIELAKKHSAFGFATIYGVECEENRVVLGNYVYYWDVGTGLFKKWESVRDEWHE